MVILNRSHRAAHTVIVKEECQIFFKAPLSRLTGMTVARLFIRKRAPAFQAARFPHKIKFLHTERTDALSLRQDNFAADRTATRKMTESSVSAKLSPRFSLNLSLLPQQLPQPVCQAGIAPELLGIRDHFIEIRRLPDQNHALLCARHRRINQIARP